MVLWCMLIHLFQCVSVCKFVLYIPLHIYMSKKNPNLSLEKQLFFISASLFPGGRWGVWFRRLYDVPRRRSNARAAGSLSDMGNLYYYADKVGLIVLLFKRQCRQSELVKIRLKQTVLDDAVFLKFRLCKSLCELMRDRACIG